MTKPMPHKEKPMPDKNGIFELPPREAEELGLDDFMSDRTADEGREGGR
jgi:hypothetical protein